MTKQDIIREVFIKYLYDDEYTIDLALRDLSDLGVVIKVDKSLVPDCRTCSGTGEVTYDTTSPSGIFLYETRHTCRPCRGTGKNQAGYEAVEPLIEGEDASKAVKDFSKGSTGN